MDSFKPLINPISSPASSGIPSSGVSPVNTGGGIDALIQQLITAILQGQQKNNPLIQSILSTSPNQVALQGGQFLQAQQPQMDISSKAQLLQGYGNILGNPPSVSTTTYGLPPYSFIGRGIR